MLQESQLDSRSEIDRLMEQYGSSLLRMSALYLKDADLAQDAVQETFIKAYRHLNDYAADDFDVAVLELPYIFGTQPGRKQVWVFLVENIRSMKGFTMWPKGGTTMVTVHQVGQAIAGALERNKGGRCYPIGWYNLSWKEMLKICHKYLGCPEKKIITIPNWMYAIGGRNLKNEQHKKGIEGGLDMVKFTDLQCSETFIDKKLGCIPLGVKEDDIDAAIGESIRLCVDILDGKAQNIVAMKGE